MTTRLHPSSPPGDRLTGHLSAFRRDQLAFLTMCARQYGEYVPLRFGPQRAVLLSRPEDIEEVLVTKNRAFIKFLLLRNTRRLLGNGLFVSDGDLWRRQRRLLQPAFHRDRITAYGEVMMAHTERHLAGWRGGQVRDIHQDLMGLTLGIVAETLFGADVAQEVPHFGAAVTVALERISARMNSLLFLLPDTLPLPGNFAFLKAARYLDGIVDRVIASRRAISEDRGDLLSLLLNARDEDSTAMTDRQVRDEVMTLILAGHESTALALSWSCYLLAQHPAAQETLRAELQTVLGSRPPTAADVPRLLYTGMVVSEALRLYPPAWTIGREAVHACRVGDHDIPKGTMVIMSQWVMHRDPRYFEDPLTFRPERWADGLAERLPRFAYFPFGGGPRVCIGKPFALMEAVLVLATIAQRFHLAIVPGQTVTPWPTVTLRPRDGIRLLLTEAGNGNRSADAVGSTGREYGQAAPPLPSPHARSRD